MSAKLGRLSRGFELAQSVFPFTRKYLAKLKQKAVRRGCWYRELKHNERTLLDLTMRVVNKVRSFLLAKVVSRLVDRLFEAMESRIVKLVRTEGEQMARKISKIAERLGYHAATKWASDRGFMMYLVVNNLGEFDK